MNAEEKGRVIAAYVAAFVIMGVLYWFFGNRDKIVGHLKAANEEYAREDSMISRPAEPGRDMRRFEVSWRCRNQPQYATVIVEFDETSAVRSARKRFRGEAGCEVLTVKPTTKASCVNRVCGAKWVVQN